MRRSSKFLLGEEKNPLSHWLSKVVADYILLRWKIFNKTLIINVLPLNHVSYLRQFYTTCFKNGGLLRSFGRGSCRWLKAPSSHISLGQLHCGMQFLLRDSGEADGASGTLHICPLLWWGQEPLYHNWGWQACMGGSVAGACWDGFIE